MGQGEKGGAEASHDKRDTQRDRVIKSAQITFGNSVLDCIVLNISVSGARVAFGIPALVPEIMVLRLRDGSSYPACRRWARGMEIGLAFTGRVIASGDEGRIRRAGAALEAAHATDPTGWLQILRAERFFGDETLRQAAEAAEAAYMRLEATLRPHAVGTVQGPPKMTE